MSRKRDQRGALQATLALVALTAGCGWHELHHDELFGPPDADLPAVDASIEGGPDASTMLDAAPDQGPDAAVIDAVQALDGVDPIDAVDAVAAVDAHAELGATDAVTGADSSEACTPTTCATGDFCDDLSQRCLPTAGPGMLSGVVYNVCNHVQVQARVGVAGQHQCSVDLKGSYYFRANVPVGLLTLAAYAAGYKNFSVAVEVVATGTVQDIALMPDTPNGCADPPPVVVPCTCTIPGCPGVP